jgi:hypothetical protein
MVCICVHVFSLLLFIGRLDRSACSGTHCGRDGGSSEEACRPLYLDAFKSFEAAGACTGSDPAGRCPAAGRPEASLSSCSASSCWFMRIVCWSSVRADTLCVVPSSSDPDNHEEVCHK